MKIPFCTLVKSFGPEISASWSSGFQVPKDGSSWGSLLRLWAPGLSFGSLLDAGHWPFIPVWCVARTCINFGITCSGPFLANTFTRCPHGRGRLSKQGSLSQISCRQTRVQKILISSVLRNTSLKRERKRERTKQAYLLNHERNKSTNADKFLLISL